MTNRKLPQTSPPHRQLHLAARDFFFLQNQGYPRRPALEWVGNRYELDHLERQLLHRGVFGQREALRRLARRSPGIGWREEWLVVDGHNVQITVESALMGRPVLRANDGPIRDLAGQSARFRLTETTDLALDLIFRFLSEFRPARALFLFDAPISQSGHLAKSYQESMNMLGLPGSARAVPVPEREFPYAGCVVASSDQAVLEKAARWVDLADLALSFGSRLQLREDFSSLILTRMIFEDCPQWV
jgi:hypothetical protein